MESPGEDTGRVVPPAPHTPAGPQPNGSNKIIGRNVNGTSKSRSAINLLMFYIFLLNFKCRRHVSSYLRACVMLTEFYMTFSKLPAILYEFKSLRQLCFKLLQRFNLR